jgi:hypothetical protein
MIGDCRASRNWRSPEAVKIAARKLWSPFMPDAEIDTELMILGESVDKPQKIWKTFEQVIGRPGRNYAQWVADHANDFH